MKFLFLTLLVFSSSAFAVQSTQTLTPKDHQFEAELGADYLFGTVTTSGSPSVNNTISGTDVPVSFYYGLNEQNSVGISTTYVDKKVTSDWPLYPTTKISGVDGVLLGYKGNFDMEMFTLFVSAGLSIPLEKAKQDQVAGTMTQTSGQMKVPVQIGYVSHVPKAKIGGILSYTYANQGTADVVTQSFPVAVSVDTKGGGGYGLQAFVELPNALNLNVALIYNRYYTINASGIVVGQYMTGYDELGIRGSLRLQIADNFEVIPSGQYIPRLHASEAGYSKFDTFAVGAAVRFLF